MGNTSQNQKTKVLIVEDEGEMSLLLNIFLHGKDMEVDHVSSLVDAEEYLHQEQPTVILLDNKLPDGYGVDLISFVRRKYPTVKIIMISGLPTAKDVALENGADMFLEKPVTQDQVYKAIVGLVNNS